MTALQFPPILENVRQTFIVERVDCRWWICSDNSFIRLSHSSRYTSLSFNLLLLSSRTDSALKLSSKWNTKRSIKWTPICIIEANIRPIVIQIRWSRKLNENDLSERFWRWFGWFHGELVGQKQKAKCEEEEEEEGWEWK